MSAESSRARIVFVTHPAEGAAAFARTLVERRLAACVNVTPVTSVYRWEGRVAQDDEALLVLKTMEERLEELERVLEDEHPYALPEFVAFAPEHVERSYLDWLADEVEPRP